MYDLKETSIPMMVTTMAATKGTGIKWIPTDTEVLYKIMFETISNFLYEKKDTKAKTVLRVQDTKGPLLFAAIVEYHPNDEEDMPGNWSYIFTQDEKLIDECPNNYDIADLVFAQVANYTAHYLGIEFKDFPSQHRLFIIASKCLLEWLDQNATEKEETEITIKDYFIASVGVEDGEKIISIVPEEEQKRKIKDDKKIEE